MTTIENDGGPIEVDHHGGKVYVERNADDIEFTPDGARAFAHILTVHADAAAADPQ
jgi:hypothetical protein